MKKPLIAALLCAGALLARAAPPATYPSPDAAVDAFVDAVARHDRAAMGRVLGDRWTRLLPPEGVDADERRAFVDKARTRRDIEVDGDTARVAVGEDGWPLPIPLVRQGPGWRFDTAAGIERMTERRIGANERFIIQAALAYVDAQREYAQSDWNGDGLHEYARRLMSSTGQRDGLVWSPELGGQSPLGDLYVTPRVGNGYHGYRFRILEAQGPAAPGGARSYLIGGRMTGGFALVAWPVRYGETGVMTFVVNQDGVVHERDLGRDTDRRAAALQRYDPAPPWRPVTP